MTTDTTLPIPAIEDIPADLVRLPQWVVWRFVDDDKAPFQPRAPRYRASVAAPAHWATFDLARRAAAATGSGVGFVFTAPNGLIGLDLDRCRDDQGNFVDWAEEIIALANTYTEISPSRRGVKLWVRAALPPGAFSGRSGGRAAMPGGGAIEVFYRERYFTVTGWRLPDAPLVIADGQRVIDHILRRFFTVPSNAQARLEDAPTTAPPRNGARGDRAAAQRLAQRQIDAVRLAREGSRNNTLYTASHTIAGLCAAGLVDEPSARRALADAAAVCGLPGGEAERTIASGWRTGVQRPFHPEAHVETVGAEPWEPPVALPAAEWRDLPAIPLDALPPVLRVCVENVSAHTQVDATMTAAFALGLLSGAIAATFVLEPFAGWVEHPNLYVIVVSPTAERKTATLRVLLEPFVRREAQWRRAEAERRKEFDRLERAVEDARRRKDAADADALRERLEALRPPELTQELLVGSFTIEALASLMARNGGRALAASGEGAGLEAVTGRYSDGRPDLDFLLAAFSGDFYAVERRARSEFIERPTLALVQALQPSRFREISAMRGVVERGLLGRCLTFAPRSMAGRRTFFAPASISDAALRAYADLVDEALSLPVITDPAQRPVVRFTAEALLELKLFFDIVEGSISAIHAGAAAWAARAAGHAARLAAVLHVARHGRAALSKTIDAEIAAAARRIAETALEHHRALLASAAHARYADLAHALCAWLRRERPVEVTRRELFRAMMGRSDVRRVADIGDAVEALVETAHLRPVATTPGRGRPSERFIVNPLLYREDERAVRDIDF